MRDIRALLRAGAGEKDASFGVGDVFARSSMLRRRRLAAMGTLAVLIVAVVALAGSSGFEWFSSDRERMTPVTPDRRDAVLVYSSNGELFVTRGDSGPTNITNSPEEETNPAISPDGSTIVFERVEGPDSALNWALHSVPVEGGDMRRLTSGLRADGYDRSPAWSPDGRSIAFVRHLARGSEIIGTDAAIVVMNADGSGQRELTQRPGDADVPAWARDAESVLFTAAAPREQTSRIVRVPLEGETDGSLEVIAEGNTPAPLSGGHFGLLRVTGPSSTDAFLHSISTGRERRLTRQRQLTDLVAFGDGGLAAAETGSRAEAVGPRPPSRIVVLRGPNPWKGRFEPLMNLQGFSIWVGR